MYKELIHYVQGMNHKKKKEIMSRESACESILCSAEFNYAGGRQNFPICNKICIVFHWKNNPIKLNPIT